VKIDPATLVHLAHLARLEMDAAEIGRFSKDLTRILDYFAVIDAWDPGGSLPEPEVPGRPEPLRADRAQIVLSYSEALSCAPEVDEGEFTVPPVIRRDPRGTGEVG